MSNIRKSDVKNHLSPRFRTRLSLCQPTSESDAAGLAREKPASAAPMGNGPMENPLNLPSTSARKSLTIVAHKGVQD